MAAHPYLILDVFTDTPLAGNQLAVFTEGSAIPEERLQPLALEMGFSETVFVYPPDGAENARVRIFTPANEVPFAGHPVLGTAVALAIAGDIDHVELLRTAQGIVPLDVSRRTASAAFGRMRQPVPTVAPYPDPEALFAALRVPGSRLPVALYDNGLPNVFVALPDPAAVARVRPDFGALAELTRGESATAGFNCFAGSGRMWTTRMFAPADGVPEDAATGSAAGPLACHLARHGVIGFGEEIKISQGAQIGRPSTLLATAFGSADAITRVEVAGDAVVVASGAFHLP